MKPYFLLLTLILVSCSKNYKSPHGYNIIKLYEYNGKPWDSDATYNKLYNSYRSDDALYSKIEKLNYSFKKSFTTNQKIDSALFKKQYEQYRPRPQCPAGYNRIMLLYDDSELKYVIKFNEYCNQCFLINSKTNSVYFLKIGYGDFIKLLKQELR